MKRKFFSTLLFGALACATLGTVTSCKDYDDDINNLQSQIDALSKKIDDINTQITNGAILTSVTPTTNGLTIALSNGKTYDITNGKDGKDGTAWTISEDGYWVKDGNKTTYKAVATDGKDGKYYVPNTTTGNFDVVEDGKTTDSGISWKLSAVTGIKDNNVLTLYGIPNKEGVVDPAGVVINLSARLRALVFAGDEYNEDTKEYSTQYATDAAGLPLLRFGSFYFNSEKLNNKDSKEEQSEKALDDSKKVYNNKNNTDSLGYKTYAYYHVNPSNVNVDDLKKLSFNVQPNNKLVSRAEAKGLTVGAEFVSYDSENGVVKVLLKGQGTPATENLVSAIKLQSTLDDDAIVTSDAATLKRQDVGQLALVDKKKRAADNTDYHFRRASQKISNRDDWAGIKDEAAWIESKATKVDLELAVGETIDLNTIVGVHEFASNPQTSICSTFDMSRLGLSVSYELVKNYKLGTNGTDQANFISLSGSNITPKVYDEAGNAAVGREPIIRAALKSESGAVVEYAYIKVRIVEAKQADKAFTITPDNGVFKYSTNCSDVVLKTTVKQMNVDLYNKAGLSYDDFYTTYSTVELNPTGDDYKTNVGTVETVNETFDGVPTKLLKWTVTAKEIWANAGKEIQHVVIYKNVKSNLKLTLKATVSTDGIVKEKDFTSADLISEYWKNGKAQFNVAVPTQDETASENCTFVNNLNSPFQTKNGKLVLGNGTTYSYYFCKDNAGETTVGGVSVKYTVDSNGLTLKAQLKKTDGSWDTATDVLKIDNNASSIYNSVTVQDNDVAKKLLNTGALEAKFGVNANTCFTSDDNVSNVKVTFNGEDHFIGLFLRPLNVASKAADNFIDGVNFGTKGSWIKMKDLVNPTDWRNYSFTGSNEFLWKYYGITDVTAVDDAECDLNGTRQALPATIKLAKSTESDTFWDGVSYKDKDNKKTTTVTESKWYESDTLGFLTYQNNGTTVNKDFNIFVKVKITYKWGTIESGEITVPVKTTVGQ